jgi:hypothetical protein
VSVVVTVRENGCETAATSIQCDFGILIYFLLKLIYKCDLSRTTVLEANILDKFPLRKIIRGWNGQENFFCVKVIRSNPELTRQRKIFLSVPIHG